MYRKAKNNKSDIQAIYKLLATVSVEGGVLNRTVIDVQNHIESFWVCEINGKIVGSCALDVYNEKIAEVRSLAVMPGFRGCGIGSKLVTLCINEAKEKGISEVLAITEKEVMFNSFGFSELVGRKKPLLLKLTDLKTNKYSVSQNISM